MKLAECLLQDRPIRREGLQEWYSPKVKNRGTYALMLECTNEKMSGYTLHDFFFDVDDWEIKPMTLGEKILEIMKDHTRSAEKALSDIRYIIESGNYKE